VPRRCASAVLDRPIGFRTFFVRNHGRLGFVQRRGRNEFDRAHRNARKPSSTFAVDSGLFLARRFSCTIHRRSAADDRGESEDGYKQNSFEIGIAKHESHYFKAPTAGESAELFLIVPNEMNSSSRISHKEHRGHRETPCEISVIELVPKLCVLCALCEKPFC
jgi:hypothetical protein